MEKRRNTLLMKQMFLTLLPSQIMTSLASHMGQIINSLIVGNALPKEALAAISFATPMITILVALSVVISTGAYVVCGDYIGRARYDEIHMTFTSAVEGLAIIGIIATILIEIFAEPLAMLLGAKGDALPMTTAYIRGYIIGLTPLLINPCLTAFLNMGGQRRYVVISTIIYAIVNLILGILNVRVLGGGIWGMGLVASIATYGTLIFFAVKFMRNKDLGHLIKGAFRWNDIGHMLKLGLGGAGMNICCSVRLLLMNRACMRFGGTDAVSATGILMNSTSILGCIAHGINSVATMSSSVAAGSRNASGLKKLYAYIQTRGCAIELIVGAVQFVFARQLAMLFGAEGAVLELSVIAIRCYSISLPLQQFLNYDTISFYNSLRRIKLNNCIVALGTLIVPAIGMYTLGPVFGPTGVWSVYPIAQAVGIIFVFIVAWTQLGHAPKNLGDWLFVEKTIKVPEDHAISIFARTMEEVTKISEQVQALCKRCGMNQYASYVSGLCLEEMAGNVVEHGFTKGKPGKDYVVEIFTLVDDDNISMSIRDNAPSFNPKERLAQHQVDPEHPEKNIGIRIVDKLASRVVYQSTFNFNVLNIEIEQPT